MATPTPQQLEDTLRAQRRAHDQDVQREIAFAAQNIEQLRKIKRPSVFWYVILIYAAILADIFDIAEAICVIWTGGSCGIVSIPVNIIIASIFIIIGYIQSRPITKVRRPSENIIGIIGNIDGRINLYRQVMAATYREGRKIGQLRRPLRFVARKLGTITKFTRSPFRQTVIKNLLQIVPFLDLWFWQVSAVRRTHKNRMEAYEQAQKLITQYEDAQRTENTAFNVMQEAEYEAKIEANQEEKLKEAA